MTKHFVEFMFPGIIVSESTSEEIASREAKVKLPKGSFGYRFFDEEQVELGGEILRGERKNPSGIFYVGGKIKTLEDISKEQPGSILEANMRNNKYDRVVMTNRGQAMPMEAGDVII